MTIQYSEKLVSEARKRFQMAVQGKVIDHVVITDEFPDDIAITISSIVFTDGTVMNLESSACVDSPEVYAKLDNGSLTGGNDERNY